jgi:uncharacterized protein (DUF305 family)
MRLLPESPRGRIATAIVSVVAALAVGIAIGVLIPILSRPGDDSPEAGFARDMASHHAQAVQMALLAYSRVDDPELKTVAYDIMLQQQYEIGIMDTWLDDWHLSRTPTGPRMAWMPEGTAALKNGLMPGMASKAELAQLEASTGHQTDVLFSQLMLRHHLGGLHMIDGILKQTDNDKIVPLATQMKGNQQSEVDLFQRKLTELGAAPLPN